MKSFSINNKEYTYPESLAEVSLRDFIEISDLSKKELTGIELASEIVRILTGVEQEILSQAEPRLVLTIYNELEPLLSEKPTQESVKHFVLDDQTFFVPALGDSKWGQFVAVEKINSIFQGKVEGIPYLLATLCLKDGETYESLNAIEAHTRERVELMKELDVPTAIAISNGFFLAYQKSKILTEAFSRLEKVEAALKTEMDKMIENLSSKNSIKNMGFGQRLTRFWQRQYLTSLRFLIFPRA